MAVVLVTNDDGIESPGLHALAAAVVEGGHRVIVAAPAEQSSGSSASILGADHDGRVHVDAVELEGLDGATCFSVRAAPGLIALLASHGAFGAVPDAVLSGVNRGANVGRAVLHSGTVGAALTAGGGGARGLAVSLDVGLSPTAHHWGVAVAVARPLIEPLLVAEPGTVLNLNVPNDPTALDRPVRSSSLAPFGIVQTTATEPGEGTVRLTVSEASGEFDPESDVVLLRSGYPTLTAITGIGEAAMPGGLA